MDYEKKYKEAIEKLRGLHDDYDAVSALIDIKEELEHIFPELAESEDERIRKAIHIYLDWLDGRKDYAPRGEYSIRDMIAWLEKQQPKASKVEEAMRDVEKKAKAFTEANKGLTSDEILAQMRGEGCGENASEDERIRKAIIALIEWSKSYSTSSITNDDAKKMLAWLEKQGEQKSAWSEEDKVMLDKVIERLHKHSAGDEEYLDIYYWLIALKDRVQPQPKQEWSEEDEHRIEDTIYFLDTAKKHYASAVELDACIDWLKSLKQRIGGGSYGSTREDLFRYARC